MGLVSVRPGWCPRPFFWDEAVWEQYYREKLVTSTSLCMTTLPPDSAQ